MTHFPRNSGLLFTPYEQKSLDEMSEWLDGALQPRTPDERKPIRPDKNADKPLIIVCMIPRSGSTLLSSLMEKTGQLGRPTEALSRRTPRALPAMAERHKAVSIKDLLQVTITRSRSANGVAAIKADLPQLFPFFVDPNTQAILKRATFVYLTREDVLGQAISRYRGFESGVWHLRGDEKAADGETGFDFAKIRSQVKLLVEQMSSFERLFAMLGIRPVRLTYEEMVADTAAILQRIAGAAGLELTSLPGLEESGLKRVAGDTNERLRMEFLGADQVRKPSAAKIAARRAAEQ